MKKTFLFFSFSFFVVSLNAQNPFRIRVVDAETSDNITKALVYIEEIALPDQETDVNGVAIFQNVPNDRKVKVVVRKKGYISEQTEIVANVAIKVDNFIIIKLKKEPTTPPVIIWGEVTDKNKEEIESATVEVNILGKSYKGTTNESGNYQIKIDATELRAVSSFQLEVKKTGCDRYKSTETVPQSGHVNKDIVLSCSLVNSAIKPKENPPIEPLPPTEQFYEDNHLTIAFKDCKKQGANLQIKLIATAKDKDIEMRIYGSNSSSGYTRIFDNNGNEYKTSAIKVANTDESQTIKLVRDLPTNVLLSFKDVNESAKLVSLVELSFVVYGTSGHQVAKFRNLVIK